MHDRGQSSMEQGMNEFVPEFGAYSGEASYETYAGESALQEIFSQELPLQGEVFGGYQEAASFEAPYQEAQSFEAPYQETQSFEGPYQEVYGEAPGYETATFETQESQYGEIPGETAGFGPSNEAGWGEVLSEEDELALASELLEVRSDQEVDQFLGGLIRRVGGLARSPLGKALGGVLRGVARTALPLAGRALGAVVGGPAGAMIGGQLAGMASKAMGLEISGMAPQAADFAAARQFVRFAADATRRAQVAPPGVNPNIVVRRAVTGAARKYAPGLLGAGAPRLRVPPMRNGRRGMWVRRGGTIVLFGV
jgi:hypothetical protein